MYQNDASASIRRHNQVPTELVVYEDRKDPKTSNRRKKPKETTSQKTINKRREMYLRDGSQ